MKSYLIESFLRLIYPATCGICKKNLHLEERTVCSGCSEHLQTLSRFPENLLLDSSFEYLDHVWGAFSYLSPLKELLHSVKYAHRDYLLKAIQQPLTTMAETITADNFYDAMLPVPIDRQKYIERHFNQVEMIAEMIVPRVTPPLQTGILHKSRPIPSQTSLSKAEREINIYGAFRLKHSRWIKGKALLLIDDVFTTGSTANEAARILKEAGAKRVDLLALACTAGIGVL